MRSSRDFYPVVLIMGAMLIIALVLVMIYMLERLSEEQDTPALPAELSTVGMEAEPGPQGWRPLFNGHTLDGWEITSFGPQGPVSVGDSSIILTFGDGATGITWEKEFPAINYEISLEAMRITGNDFFCGLTFPVDSEFCTLITGGWGGSLVGISSIDGEDASENFTSTNISFEDGRWYHIRVKVDTEAIKCFIEDEQVVYVPVQEHSFSVRSEVGLSRPLGIATWFTTGAVRNIKFREI
ncbi:MAG: DUF1080 domain-containing protein [Bacteroidales bacterium]